MRCVSHLSVAIVVYLSALTLSAQGPTDTLDIYWIDVEGGAATLIVTPAQESVLMDAGWARSDDRDVLRIQAAMRNANVDRIDYFIASHFHGDHVGGLPALSVSVDIGQFIDHGDPVGQDDARGKMLWDGYLNVSAGKRRTVAQATSSACAVWSSPSSPRTAGSSTVRCSRWVPIPSVKAHSRGETTKEKTVAASAICCRLARSSSSTSGISPPTCSTASPVRSTN